MAAGRDKRLALDKPEQFDSSSGIGVRDTVAGQALAQGNGARLMQQAGVDVTALAAQAEALLVSGASVMMLAVDGILAVADPVKPTTADARAALRKVDVRVVLGTGTDVAMNSAQLTLVKGDLRGIATARALAVNPVANMRQNLAFAFVYNALRIPWAAGVLYPFTGWLLLPLVAALAMSLSPVSVIGHALRLRGAAVK